MINKKDIEAAAQTWAVRTNKKFPHLSIPEFIAGAMWAIEKMESEEGMDAVKCKNCGSTDLYLGHSGGRCNECKNPV